MNIAGHIAVASALIEQTPSAPPPIGGSLSAEPSDNDAPDSDRSAVLLGSALPDICNIARVRLRNRSDQPSIVRGIGLHHQTDAAFHNHEWFRSLMGEAMEILIDNGVARGPARACAHVGPELLLDGALLEVQTVQEDTERSFRSIKTHIASLTRMVDESSQQRWSKTLMRLSNSKPPQDHNDPVLVTERLQRILQHRERLALPDSAVGQVVDVLSAIQPKIKRDALWLVAALASTLAADAANRTL